MFLKRASDFEVLSDTLIFIPLFEHIFIYDCDKDKGYIALIKIPEKFIDNNFLYDIKRQFTLPTELLDLESLYYIKNNTEFPLQSFFSPAELLSFRRNKNVLNTPLANQYAFATKLAVKFKDLIYNTEIVDKLSADTFYRKCLIPFRMLSSESQMALDKNLFSHFFPSIKIPKYLTVDYDLFTSTSRPKIKTNPVDIFLKEKKKGYRDCVISQFPNGKIVLFDYDSFHLRLTAEEAGCNFGSESAHKVIAKDLYGLDDIPKDIYDKVKASVFKVLYANNLDSETEIIEHPILSKTRAFGEELLNRFSEEGKILTSLHERPILATNLPAMEFSKALSYYILSKETEVVSKSISDLYIYLKDKRTKLLIVLYDAFYLDLHPTEEYILPHIEQILSHGGKYPVKGKIGQTANL